MKWKAEYSGVNHGPKASGRGHFDCPLLTNHSNTYTDFQGLK